MLASTHTQCNCCVWRVACTGPIGDPSPRHLLETPGSQLAPGASWRPPGRMAGPGDPMVLGTPPRRGEAQVQVPDLVNSDVYPAPREASGAFGAHSSTRQVNRGHHTLSCQRAPWLSPVLFQMHRKPSPPGWRTGGLQGLVVPANSFRHLRGSMIPTEELCPSPRHLQPPIKNSNSQQLMYLFTLPDGGRRLRGGSGSWAVGGAACREPSV